MVQAHSAIPFPSSPSRSMHASPSVSNQWDSPTSQIEFAHLFNSPTPTQASSSSQQKTHQTPERPSQPHTPLTPPLTPASSGSGSAGGDANDTNASVYATTPARGPAAPPPTPASAGLLSHSHSNSNLSHMGPPSPVAVGTGSSTGSGAAAGGGWPVPTSPQRARPVPHRLDIETNGSGGTGTIGSPRSERSGRSVDLGEALSEADRVVTDMRSGDSSTRDGSTSGERYLLVGNVPNDAAGDELRDAFRPCGDVKGICLRFQETDGIVILAFHDCRLTVHAERLIGAQGQTYFGGRRLRAERMGAGALRKLMGDSEFINETEGEVLVTADGKIDANSLQSIVSGFGELRAFSQTNVNNAQAYIAEYFDCRNAKNAMDALNGRSIFGIRLRLVPKHAAAPDLLSREPFPQNSDNSKSSRHGGLSQPTSPLTTSSAFARMHADPFNFSTSRQELPAEDGEADTNPDTSNSSPFHGTRALPLAASPLHSHALALHAGGARRISTGSVGVLPGGAALHQSTSEQDLRRRAAANNAACTDAQDGWIGDHARRTSDTYCFDAVRRAVGEFGLGQGGGVGMGPLGRPRTRAISDSSASPRVVSPSDGFSTTGMGVGVPDHTAYDEPATPEHSTSTGASGYYRDERDSGDAECSALTHSRIPTASDSSLGGPHTPSPGPVSYGVGVSTYYAGLPGLLAPPHHGAGQYYLSSPLGAPTSPAGVRYGYAPPGAGYSPGGLSVGSTGSSPSSLHSPSHASMFTYSPSHQMHGHLPASARGALDVTRDPPAERNQVDLDRIAAGLDTRTTVMIKNIPNKLSDKDLVEFIGRVSPRKIDFLYLRMDFQNGCNVGYAFVNFIHVRDLLHFARTKLGVKWNMFSSEKVLQMSYANYQGKEALVEKFKNSCVMDEREEWRPKIFYSTGPQQGLPEPFPAPTHFRRKERSAQNRGALFVPSAAHAHSHGSGGGTGAGAGAGMLGAPFRRPNQHPQNLARQEKY